MNSNRTHIISGTDVYVNIPSTDGLLIRSTGDVYISIGHETPSDDSSFLLSNASLSLQPQVSSVYVRPADVDTTVWCIL